MQFDKKYAGDISHVNHRLVSEQSWTLHKKWSFPFRISSENVIKYAVYCEFDHISWSNS